MIVKILSTSNNFESVNYNEHKHDTGKGRLLVAANFDGLLAVIDKPRKSDYIAYFKTIASTNKRVSNKEFHAVISTKGREHSSDQLKEIAIQYLEMMGYSKNPYLIYQHSDTKNNHVHMVSTRVDKEGNRINDSFEKIRSQEAVQQIIENNPKNEAKLAFEEGLNYNFSTLAQFKLILELKGFKVVQDKTNLNLYKYGGLQGTYMDNLVGHRISQYLSNKARALQLKAIFNKHKIGISTDEFVSTMKRNFGLDLIFHQKGNKDMPYGYTVVDHQKKSVYKGSEILKLNLLLSNLTSEERLIGALGFLLQVKEKPIKFRQVQVGLSNYGYSLKYDGRAVLNNDEQFDIQLDLALLKRVKYLQRAYEASQYGVSTNRDKDVLSKLFFINKDDISNEFITPEKISTYRTLLSSIDQRNGIEDGLRESKWLIAAFERKFFLIDKESKVIIDIDQIDERGIHFSNLEHIDLNDNWSYQQIESAKDYIGPDLTRSLLDLFAAIGEPNEVGKKRKLMRKPKRY